MKVNNRKLGEIEYYDKKAEKILSLPKYKWQGDFERFNPFLLESYQFLQGYLKYKCKGKKILDFGCGNGIHSFWFTGYRGNVVGIDLSEKSLKIAKEKAKLQNAKNVNFLLMDCENLDFPDNCFDIVFDGGTFSSIDLKKAYSEIARVLKPDGFLIGIETFGHNPFTNLKRKINLIFGKRTGWASSHIFKMKDFEGAKKYFSKAEIYFFHPISWIIFPFLKMRFFQKVLKFLNKIDNFLLKIKFLRKYSFKVVFVCHGKKVI